MGSFVLEQLQDLYPKQIVVTYSVFPDQNKQSEDIVVGPYNSLLTMKRLVQCVDAVVVLDNAALDRIVAGRLGVPHPTMEETNSLVATVMCASTATLRFPSPVFNNVRSILTTTCPSANCHFLVSGYTPLTVHRQVLNSAFQDLMGRELQRQAHPAHDILPCCPWPGGCLSSWPSCFPWHFASLVDPPAQENVIRKTSVYDVLRRLLQVPLPDASAFCSFISCAAAFPSQCFCQQPSCSFTEPMEARRSICFLNSVSPAADQLDGVVLQADQGQECVQVRRDPEHDPRRRRLIRGPLCRLSSFP